MEDDEALKRYERKKRTDEEEVAYKNFMITVGKIVSGCEEVTNEKLAEFMVSDFVKDRPAIINLVLLHAIARILRGGNGNAK